MAEYPSPVHDIPVDFTQLRTMVGNNPPLFRKLGDQALREYPAMFAQIQEAVQHGDSARLWRLAHTLKGSLANLGAEEARRLAYSLELLGKSEETANAAAILAELGMKLDALYVFFNRPHWVEEI